MADGTKVPGAQPPLPLLPFDCLEEFPPTPSRLPPILAVSPRHENCDSSQKAQEPLLDLGDSRFAKKQSIGSQGHRIPSLRLETPKIVAGRNTEKSHRGSLASTSSEVRADMWLISEADLMDNDCAEALRKLANTASLENFDDDLEDAIKSITSAKISNGLTDWSKPLNRQRLRDLCSFIRRLFWAFEDEDVNLKSSIPREYVSHSKRFTRWVVKHEAFSFVYFILTIYALFGPDLGAMMGHVSAHNETLATISTVVLFMFLLEAGLNSWATPGYFLSGNFWIDIFATLTIIGDTVIVNNELVESDAAVAGRGTRMARLVRLGGRSSRFMKLMRVARAAQVVRLLPGTRRWMQRWMAQSTHNLALVLMYKRLWHVFKCLDKNQGVLSDADLDLFYTALALELQAEFQQFMKKGNFELFDTWSKFQEMIADVVPKSRHMLPDAGEKAENTFENVVGNMLQKRIGKVVLQRCIDDIECMKDSCALLQTAISRLTLKICLVVLSILIALPLLEMNVVDLSRDQGLAMLREARRGLTTTVGSAEVLDIHSFCSSANGHAVRSGGGTAKLKLLVIDSRVYVDTLDKVECSAQAPVVVGTLLEFAESRMSRLHLQPTEMSLRCYPDTDCRDDAKVSSLVLWDVSDETFSAAAASLAYTSVVILMMVVLVIFFAVAMKRKSTQNLFHPLWDLLDDMCALKSMEVVASGTQCQQGEPTAETVLRRKRGSYCPAMCRDKTEVAQELRQLRDAFTHLKGAILSWGKYVPTILLKQLYEAGIEATIGCTRSDVTIFFCDIANFQELCDGKKPQEVLHVLGDVLQRIHSVIEEQAGTLLEFIGDEVLAVYNAPAQIPDHTKCALTAAVEILEKTKDLPFLPRLQCSVHRANVLAGNLGSPTRMKYGVMGDGVNLTARLKSLNSRYGTQLLVSSEALAFEGSEELFITRPIGNLVLKGRTSPTPTFEVLGKRLLASYAVSEGAAKHVEAFQLFTGRDFSAAKALFTEAHGLLSSHADATGVGDRPSHHMLELCDKYIAEPPEPDWDGREHLTKKAW